MFERDIAEASAFALDRRNFDYLPDEQAARWRGAFLKARGRQHVPGPNKLIIELLNSCNLDCPMCRVGQHGVDLTRRMSLPVFETVIQSSDLRAVRLNGLGESTLLPDFQEYVALVERRECGLELITNGTGQLADYASVSDAGGHVLISWDAAQPRLFEQLRRPSKWADQVEHLRRIAKRATEARARCSLIFTLQKANLGELGGVVELAGSLGLGSVQVNVARAPAARWLVDNRSHILADIAQATERANALGLTLFAPDQIAGEALDVGSRTHTASSGCDAPWLEAVIRWNGDVQTCNMFNPYTYGNIHRHPLADIWTNAFAEVFRGKVNGADHHPYCRACAYMPSAYGP